MEFVKEKCSRFKMKSGKRHMVEGVEVPNQGKIRAFGVMETYKYLRIFEADTIKHAEMKEKHLKKNASEERENYSKLKL